MPGTYLSDMILLADGDTATPATVTEATAYNAGGTFLTSDTDNFIQGTAGMTAISSKTAGSKNSVFVNFTSTAIPSDSVLSIWLLYPLPSAIDDFVGTVNGGGEMVITGTAVGTITTFRAGGSDVNPEGGWQHYVVDPRNAGTGPETTVRTTISYAGGAWNQVAALRAGALMGVDAIRYGRMKMEATGGTSTSVNHASPLSSSAANFPQMADYNDYNAGGTPTFGAAKNGGFHRFGQFQAITGAYKAKGLISLGTASTSVYFDDLNRTINFDDSFLTYNTFNKIEIRNSASIVNLTGCTFSFIARDPIITSIYAPATPKGNFEVIDSTAGVNITGGAFIDMGTFIFGSNSNITDTAFRRCGGVTGVTGGIFTECTFRETTANVALTLSSGSLNQVNTCFFVGDSTSHAINAGTISANTTVNWNSTYDTATYASTSVASSGSSVGGESEVVLVNVNSGITYTINVIGGTAPTYRNTGTGTVVIQQSATFKITNVKLNTEIRLFKQSDNSSLGGVESAGNTATYDSGFTEVIGENPDANGNYSILYTYSTPTSIPINVVAISLDYQYFKTSHTLLTSNTSLQISQVIDRNYIDPP